VSPEPVTIAPDTTAPVASVRVLTPAGVLGAGFPESTIERGMSLRPDVIALDGGSTDSGPYYLGAGQPKIAAAAVRRDLRVLLKAAAAAGIPLVIGSCGTSGTDSGVDWVAGMVAAIQQEEGLSMRVARIYAEQEASELKQYLDTGRLHALPPLGELTADVLESCTHIVAMMGHEPIVAALENGAQVVLAGRATDTALAAAVPLMKGMPPGPTWHASKIVECGGQATTDPRAGGVLATIDAAGFFTIEPLSPDAACTPTSVAAHMLYETVDPFRMREPDGTLDVSGASYAALDDRIVRVDGSRFETAAQYTNKLEGARVAGYETLSFSAIRDPLITGAIDEWAAFLRRTLVSRVEQTLALSPDEYAFDLRLYGHNGVLDELEPDSDHAPREVGVMLLVNAHDQATATAVAKIANPLMLHLPTPDMTYLPSLAFATSPAEVERGPAYEFVLNHVVDSPSPTSLFRIEIEEAADV